MSCQYCFTYTALEHAVRCGDNSSKELDVISCYVHMSLERAKKLPCIEQARIAHLSLVNHLLETLCDPLVSVAWRRTCDTYIKRLQPLLFEILSEQEYQAKQQEISTLRQFFLEPKMATSEPEKSKPLKPSH